MTEAEPVAVPDSPSKLPDGATDAGDPASPSKVAEEGASPTKLDEDGLPKGPAEEEVKKSNISEETMEDMKALWDVFDLDATNNVPMKELLTIMRALDFDLAPEALDKVAADIDPENTGFIRFEKLMEVMEDKLKDTDTPQDMMEHFKHLDKEGSGEIGAHKFKHYMKTMGMRLDDDKLD